MPRRSMKTTIDGRRRLDKNVNMGIVEFLMRFRIDPHKRSPPRAFDN